MRVKNDCSLTKWTSDDSFGRCALHESGTHCSRVKWAPDLNVLICRVQRWEEITSLVLFRPNRSKFKGGSSASCHRAGMSWRELGDIPCQFSQLSYCSAFSWLRLHKFPDLLLPGKWLKMDKFYNHSNFATVLKMKPLKDSLSKMLKFDPSGSNDLW